MRSCSWVRGVIYLVDGRVDAQMSGEGCSRTTPPFPERPPRRDVVDAGFWREVGALMRRHSAPESPINTILRPLSQQPEVVRGAEMTLGTAHPLPLNIRDSAGMLVQR